MAWQLIALVDFAGTQVQLPGLIRSFPEICNSCSRGSDILLQPPRASTQMYIILQSYTHIIKNKSQKNQPEINIIKKSIFFKLSVFFRGIRVTSLAVTEMLDRMTSILFQFSIWLIDQKLLLPTISNLTFHRSSTCNPSLTLPKLGSGGARL